LKKNVTKIAQNFRNIQRILNKKKTRIAISSFFSTYQAKTSGLAKKFYKDDFFIVQA
jgi:predicted nucleotide-binding protein (sugar kinase/HSP70/actin superfamily)